MRPRLYLDTSVISAYVDQRLPERQRATVEFWGRLVGYEVSVSELTLTEAQATADTALRRQLVALVAGFRVLAIERDARDLS